MRCMIVWTLAKKWPKPTPIGSSQQQKVANYLTKNILLSVAIFCKPIFGPLYKFVQVFQKDFV